MKNLNKKNKSTNKQTNKQKMIQVKNIEMKMTVVNEVQFSSLNNITTLME